MEKIGRSFAKPLFVIVSLIVFLLFLILVLPDQSEKAAQYTPEGAGFDTDFFYSPQEVYPDIERYSPEGRVAYIRSRWTFDLAFPFVYGFFCLTVASFFLVRLKPGGGRWYLLLLFALFAVGFDLLENTSISIMMAAYPVQLPALPTFAAAVSGCKWVTVSLALGIAAVLPVIWLISKFFVRTS